MSVDIFPDDLTATYDGEAMIAFGNVGMASTLGVRREVRFQLSEHRYWESDVVGLRATMRHAINVHDLGSDVIKSPYAVLTGTA